MVWMDIVRSPYAHAKIKSIDASEALAMPGVLAVITGKDLEAAGLHWMPTLAGDKQMVLPVDTVMYQSQEVAAVIALTRYQAADAITAVNVDYEPLQVVVDPFKALEPDAPVLRPDRGPDKANNHIWHWESGDRAATDAALDASDRIVPIDVYIPRIHVASIETCGCIADFDPSTATSTSTSRARRRTPTGRSSASCRGSPSRQIRVKTHDIGGGFGGKVPVYPGYVIAIVASLTLGRPVKWIEDRSREPPGRLVRPRLPRPRRAGPQERRHDDRPARQDARRPRLRRRRGRPDRSTRPACSTSSPAATRCRRRSSRSTRPTRTSRPAASPTAARSA